MKRVFLLLFLCLAFFPFGIFALVEETPPPTGQWIESAAHLRPFAVGKGDGANLVYQCDPLQDRAMLILDIPQTRTVTIGDQEEEISGFLRLPVPNSTMLTVFHRALLDSSERPLEVDIGTEVVRISMESAQKRVNAVRRRYRMALIVGAE